MLGMFKPKPEEEIRKDRQKYLDDMIYRSTRLNKLIKSAGTGWQEFSVLINDYINKCKKRKAITPLDTADEKVIYELKLLDHEIFILSWMLRVPEQFIGKTEIAVKEFNKKEEE